MHWGDLVTERVASVGALAVGIDPVLDDIPLCFRTDAPDRAAALDAYVACVLDAIRGATGFVKFQSAFFEAFGSAGVVSLAKAIARAREHGFAIILDAKRGDIGSTSAAYAKAYLTPSSVHGSDLEVDCMTVNPFLGPDSVEPLVECSQRFGKGLFILAKTSNPGAGWLQDEKIQGERVSDRIAHLIAEWGRLARGASGMSAVGAVVGVTYPEDGRRLRRIMPDAVFLAPGIGPQGGTPAAVHSLRRNGGGVVVPVSRAVTKVTDLNVERDTYIALLRSRVEELQQHIR